MMLSEFCEKTGATPRQILYWAKVMPLTKIPVGDNDRNRDYDETVIHKVRTLVNISEKFGGFFSVDTLMKVFFEYEYGFFDFGDGIHLIWRVDA